MPQRVQRGRAAGRRGGPLEHPVRRVIGQRPRRRPRGPPHRLPTPLGDQPVHLDLIQPQPDERVAGRRQLLRRTGPLADHGDQLATGVDASVSDRQQLRGAGTGRDVKSHQRPVAVRRQPREDLVELHVRNAAWDPARHRRSIPPDPLVTGRLRRIVVGVGSPVPAGAVQRERVEDRPGPGLAVEVVEASQHRLAVRLHRRRIRLAAVGHRGRRAAHVAPVLAGRLPRQLQPPAEVTRLAPGRPIPAHLQGPQEPEPAQ